MGGGDAFSTDKGKGGREKNLKREEFFENNLSFII